MLPQGAARLIGPTAGFLVSYPLAAFVAGWLAERRFDRKYLTSLVAMAAGLAVIFAGGLSWLAYGPTALGLSGAVNTRSRRSSPPTSSSCASPRACCRPCGASSAAAPPATAARSARRGASLPEDQQVLERQRRGAVDQPQPRRFRVLDRLPLRRRVRRAAGPGPGRPCGSRRRRRGRPDAATCARSSATPPACPPRRRRPTISTASTGSGSFGSSSVPSTMVTLGSPSRRMRRSIDSIMGFWMSWA